MIWIAAVIDPPQSYH